jgi:Xaa-Pro aminopeptidase
MNQRLDKLRRRMGELGLSAVLVSQPQNRRYLSGFTGSSGYLLISAGDAVIATDSRYYEQSAQQAPGFRLFQATGPTEGWLPGLLTAAGDLSGKRLAFESADLSLLMFRTLRKAAESLPAGQRPRLIATTDLVEGLRVTKEPEELDALQAAVDLGDAAFRHVADRVEPGWTEKQVAWEIEKYMREHGGEAVSFDTIVAGGPWGAMPHAYPRDRALEPGEMVVIDMGVRLNGYCSDLTRTIFLGKPDDQFKKVYDIVLGAQLTAEELVQAGMTGEEAHNLAHRVIQEAGYGDKFGHGLTRRRAGRPRVALPGQEPPGRPGRRHGGHHRARHLQHGWGRRPHRGLGGHRERDGALHDARAEDRGMSERFSLSPKARLLPGGCAGLKSGLRDAGVLRRG